MSRNYDRIADLAAFQTHCLHLNVIEVLISLTLLENPIEWHDVLHVVVMSVSALSP